MKYLPWRCDVASRVFSFDGILSFSMEQPTLSAIFGKRRRFIAAPKFCRMPHKPKDEGTLVAAEISEKVSELRVTSVISWPVAQERSFERALENW